MGLREILAKLGVGPEVLQAEVAELKVDLALKRLMDEGHLTADPAIQETARKFLKADPEAFEALMRSPKPTPAGDRIFEAIQGPSTSADATEAAIQTEMAKSKINYAAAAEAVSRGGVIHAS